MYLGRINISCETTFYLGYFLHRWLQSFMFYAYSNALWNKNALGGIWIIHSKRLWKPRIGYMRIEYILIVPTCMPRLHILLQNRNAT